MTTSSGTASPSSQPGSRSGSRRSDFPPRPKSVRVWPVVPAAPPDADTSEGIKANEVPSTARQPCEAVSGRLWAWIVTAGVVALAAGVLALLLAKNLQSYLAR